MEEQTVINPVQQPNIPTPPEPKHSSFLTSKLFLITLAIVVLFTLAYAGIYLNLNSQLNQITHSNPTPTTISQPSPTPDPTANWKTYTNAKYEFQLMYPPDLKVKEQNVNTGRADLFITFTSDDLLKKERYFDYYVYKIDIGIEENALDAEGNKPLDEKGLDFIYNYIPNENTVEKLTIQGRPAVRLKSLKSILRPTFLMTVLDGKTSIGLSVTSNDVNVFSYQDMERVLSTFKFLKQSPSVTCIPRPACLDAVPRCLIPESENMCPPKPTSNQVACTQDAKQCPDGSYVSRQPPTCEFAKCP